MPASLPQRAPGVPEGRFVVLSHTRSGSTLLLNALREHPGLLVYGELFQEEEEHRRAGFGAPDEVYDTGMDGASYLEETIFRDREDPELMAIGFKLFYHHARNHEARSVWPYLIDQEDVRVIHLTRLNPLHAYVSMCEAEASGRWHVELDEAVPAVAPIRIDADDCLAFLDSLYAYRAWARHAFRKHAVLELVYERLLTDFDPALADVQRFLEVRPERLPATLRRQGTRPLDRRVTNLTEIEALLARTIHGPL